MTTTSFGPVREKNGKFGLDPQSPPGAAVQNTIVFSARTEGIAGYRLRNFAGRSRAYTPEALIKELIRRGDVSPGALGMTVEDVLDQYALAEGFEREDPSTFEGHLFPTAIRDEEVEIIDHPALGLRFWTVPATGSEALTASDALDEWANVLDLPMDIQDEMWKGADYQNQTMAWNLELIADNARKMGLDPETIGMPTRHN